MKYTNFPVYREENGILTEVEINEKNSQLYVMKQYCQSPYLEFPIPEYGFNIFHCVTGFNSWSHKIVLSQKTKEEVFAIVFPETKGLSFPTVSKLVPVSELTVELLGITFKVKDENTLISEGYYENEENFSPTIELGVKGEFYIKIDGKKTHLKLSKKFTPYSGGMSFPILNIFGIGVGLAYTNTNLPTRFYVQPVVAHKRVNLSVYKRIRTITETKTSCYETTRYEFL